MQLRGQYKSLLGFVFWIHVLGDFSAAHQLQHPIAGNEIPSQRDILDALLVAEIIPDVLDNFGVEFLINPIYPEANKRVELGNRLSPDDLELAPDLEISLLPSYFSSPSKTKYTLVLSDPDALSHDNPNKSQMCHWIVTNITLPGVFLTASHVSSLRSLLTEESEAGIIQLEPYFPPSPPPKTGYHRYVFAFLRQRFDHADLPKAPRKRAHWGYGKVGAGVREWSIENDLVVIAANFFYARNKEQ